jgi:hypothetical protein
MKKIPTALVRDPNNRAKVLPEIAPGCEWVFAGEGIPTRKYDGTCVMLDEHGDWWARREIKPGKGAPDGFIEIQYDEITGKTQGWEPMENSSFAKFHAEALTDKEHWKQQGTYELIGPKINGNPDRMISHTLVRHEEAEHIPDLNGLILSPETVMKIVRKIGNFPGWEGVVWHHPDGRMAKLKARDL